MDEQVVERIIRNISSGFGYRFPNECYRCGRGFEPRLISAIERAVLRGNTIIEAIQGIRYEQSSEDYVNPWEPNYTPSQQRLFFGPKDICCRLCIVSPHIYPTGTIVSHVTEKRIVGPSGNTSDDLMDLFDYLNDGSQRPELVVDEEHGDIRLYIEDGIPGFELPIEWDI
jgi:hypothetical protein